MTWILIKAWFGENFAWLGFIVSAMVGAAVGHLKAYEASTIVWPVRKHFGDYVRRAIYATFIALIVYWLYPYTGAPQPIAFIVTSILSVFGSETIDWMYRTLKSKIENRAGTNNSQ